MLKHLLTGSLLLALPSLVRAQDTTRVDSTGAQKLTTVKVGAAQPKGRYAPGYTRTGTRTPALVRDVPQSFVTVTRQLAKDHRRVQE